MAPATLNRSVIFPDGRTVTGSVHYFVAEADPAEDLGLTSVDKPDRLIFFDAVIGNADRHIGNWLIRRDTHEVVAIDHNRSFYHDLDWTWYRRIRQVRVPAELGEPFERFRSLRPSDFRRALEPDIDEERIEAFLDARLVLIRYIEVASRAGRLTPPCPAAYVAGETTAPTLIRK